MKIKLSKIEDLMKVQEYVFALFQNFKKNKTYTCEIKQYKEGRSLSANAYFHVLVNKISKKLGTSDSETKTNLNLEYGTIATSDNGESVTVKMPNEVDIKSFYKYSKYIGEKIENGKRLAYYVFYKQTSKLNSKEMQELIYGTIEEAKQLGIETKTPFEINEMLEMMRLEDEKQKK